MGTSDRHRVLHALGVVFVLCMTASCEDDLVTSLPVEVPQPAASVEWSIDCQAEGFIGIEAAGETAVAVSEDGTYQLDGSTWNRIADGVSASDISLGSDQSLFALSNFSLYRRDGDTWTNVKTFQSTSEYWSIPAVWAHSSLDVFVVTTEEFEIPGYYYWVENTLHHFDGSSWTTHPLAGNITIYDMWGTSPNSIYVAGSDGLYHYDGSAATKVDAAGTVALRTISGTSESDIYGIRSDGSILLFDGNAFATLPAPTASGLRAARRIDGDLFVCGNQGACYRYAGGTWVSMYTGPADHLLGVWGTSAADIVTVGSGGILQLQNGVWRRARGGASSPLRDIWVASTGEVFVVGDDGVIELRDTDGWRPMSFDQSRISLNGVAGTARDNVYAVGAGGRILHYNGITWSEMASGTAGTLMAVWAGENTAVAVGGMTIVELDNGIWSPMSAHVPPRFNLMDVWGASNGALFAVGYVSSDYVGTILRYDGSTWAPVDTEVRKRMFGVWGFAPDDVFAVGESGPQDGPTRFWAGSIYHYDGIAWTRMQVTENITSLYSMWGTSRDHLVAVGGDGLTLFDGTSWTAVALEGLDGRGLDHVHAAEGTDIFGLGRQGVVRFRFPH